eukprot:TRINITY_DN17684_c0_g1_i1.p2 TRINITY_DN17684_c0_g1~~TRINITY_DN17684_c0_g1_i1.p2  ORF type:complete len:194 (-),score=23.17 TRINITY_DN17684_c0_g1_i1:54-554(-)
MVMSLLPWPFTLVALVQFGYPLLCTLDVLKPSSAANRDLDYVQWSVYWVACVLWMTLESNLFWWLPDYVPLYLEMKLVVFLWLVHPHYKGAAYLWYAKIQAPHKAWDAHVHPMITNMFTKAKLPETSKTDVPTADKRGMAHEALKRESFRMTEEDLKNLNNEKKVE